MIELCHPNVVQMIGSFYFGDVFFAYELCKGKRFLVYNLLIILFPIVFVGNYYNFYQETHIIIAITSKGSTFVI
jgi:hypothetical protein